MNMQLSSLCIHMEDNIGLQEYSWQRKICHFMYSNEISSPACAETTNWKQSHLIRATFKADLVNRLHYDSSSSRLVYKNETHLIVKSAQWPSLLQYQAQQTQSL